jgi:hypothetical protein
MSLLQEQISRAAIYYCDTQWQGSMRSVDAPRVNVSSFRTGGRWTKLTPPYAGVAQQADHLCHVCREMMEMDSGASPIAQIKTMGARQT